MNRTKLGYLLVGAITVALIAVAMLIMSSHKAFGSVDKITWCHVEPNGNQETLHLPLQALEQAGHVDANGNPLHAGDHAGECVTPSLTPTPTVSVDVSPTPSVSPEPSTTPTQSPAPTEEHRATTTEAPAIDYQLCTYHECTEMHTPLPGPAGLK